MFFTFPEDARWNSERQAVGFGVEIGEYHGVVRVPRAGRSNGSYGRRPAPSGASKPTISGPGSKASSSGSCSDGS
jgi:hypothetical protein